MLKKLIGPLAVISLSLFACGNEETSESPGSTIASPDEIMSQIIEGSSEDERPSVSLDFNSGVEWTDEGYTSYPSEDNSYLVNGYIEGGDKLFLVQDGEVLEEIMLSENLDFEYAMEPISETQVFYLVADNRLKVGQTDVDLDEVDRVEKITFAVE
ncbi:hypothetical protein JTF06_07795 [Desemzia sp. RIT804]|uniref:hypothetical protein n=1 Tax=Desemzia sp. RIT 804 TaxID=2810209 RepID=UPI001951F53B|nr:hypothetical protein [Desemzia sp. RIT 804]MBM6614791.1 hypothetical protein [Desemzia sp. RIT 804]